MSIENVIVSYLEGELGDKVSRDVLLSAPFADLGLDSAGAVLLTGKLADHFEVDIDPVVVFEYPCVPSLASFIRELLSKNSNEASGEELLAEQEEA
ncbi:acyl carrier protein [Caballeronia sp. dw_276]|uniref:acyl carrier protein n=1 Tax=Caballeronia sp. dw_276 TaxID=2719795 RepID=UPI001BD60A36|nr:acyl carrier protein [Caballeronia sp. dw_276]